MKGICYIIFLLVVALCISCTSGKGIDVKISNQSGAEISNIIFTTTEHLDSLVFKPLKDRSTITHRLSMTENVTDGGYILRFTRNGNQKIIERGYYTNGSAMDKAVRYVIKADTVVVEFDSSY